MKVIYRGRGCEITEDGGVYQISWEQGVFGKTVQYEISKENAEKAMKSDDDAYAVIAIVTVDRFIRRPAMKSTGENGKVPSGTKMSADYIT